MGLAINGPGNQQPVLRHARGVSARSQSSICVSVLVCGKKISLGSKLKKIFFSRTAQPTEEEKVVVVVVEGEEEEGGGGRRGGGRFIQS